MICGEKKPAANGVGELTCNLEAGHDPQRHGITQGPGIPPYIHWGPAVQWTPADATWLEERHTWRKGHVRREYQTLSTWKARQGSSTPSPAPSDPPAGTHQWPRAKSSPPPR